MNPTILKMQQDLAAYRASKAGGAPASSSSVQTQAPAPVVQPAPNSVNDSIAADLQKYRSGAKAAETAPKESGGGIGGVVKSLFSAPATIIARPFQAVAELAGADSKAVDEFSNKYSGGLVAPVPQNLGDLKKDVGRAVETVALGTGAPIAGGAAFGLGNSLEQGNDLLSAQTAINTALGGAGGKVIDWVGKPILNAAGKVVGTITPQIIKDVASKGAGAIQQFAKDHQLLGGIAAKPSEKIAKGFQAVDDTAGKLFKGGTGTVQKVIGSQYPGLSKEGLQNRYVRIDAENFAKPTTISKGTYTKPTEIYNNAKSQGTDLGKEAVANGIQHDTLIEGKTYNTKDTAQALRNDAMKTSHDLIRPVLEEAQTGVELVPISTVREQMLSHIDSIPNTKIGATERATLKKNIEKRYADTSSEARAHPNGYNLTDFHDASILKNFEGKYKPNGTVSDNLRAQMARSEGEAYRKLLEKNAPAEVKVGEFKKQLQKKFQLADYLESLHGKNVPSTIVSRAVDLLGKVAGASVGSTVGGGLGGVVGYHFGGALFDSFEHLPNPVKAKFLTSIIKNKPEIFKAFEDYLGKKEIERLMRLKLPAPGESSYKEPGQLFYSSPKGKTSTVKQEAVDMASIDQGKTKQPKAGPQQRKKIQRIGEMLEPYVPPKDLPVITQKNVGKQKRLKDLYGDLPTIR